MADEQAKVEIVAEDKTGPGIASAKRSLAGLQNVLNNGRAGMTGFSSAAMSASTSMSSLGVAVGGVGAVVAALGIGKLASGFIDMGRGALQSYVEFERLGTSINALAAKEALLTGSASSMTEAMAQTATQSKELLAWIQKVAIESPFRQDDVAQAFRLSMALGFSTKEAQRLTQAMVNFTTATGAEGYAIERIARALGQINTKGKLSLEEVNQLTESGVDAMRILETATGKTGAELSKAISGGAIDAQFAIEAIIADTERLYSGAGAAAASSMGGILSSLQEMQELSARGFFTSMFEEVQPYLAGILTIVSAPEFQAGISALGERFGNFTADGLQGAADALERVDAAVTSMAAQNAPPWLTAVAGLAAMGNYDLKINIKPSVTSIETPDGGLKMEVTPYVTTITSKDGGLLKVDAEAQIISIDADTTDNLAPVQLVADWKEGTLGSLWAGIQAESDSEANAILLKAGWKDEPATVVQTLVGGLRDYMETNPVNIGFEAGANLRESLSSFSWDEYKASWSAALETWKPPLTGVAAALDAAIQGYQGLVTLDAEWRAGMAAELFNQIQANFKEPIMMVGSWVNETLTGLWNTVQGWFNSNPIRITTQSNYSPTTYTVENAPRGWDSSFVAPVDINQPYPEYQDDPRYRAIGDGFFRGGLAMVGEGGPELVVLPRGAQVYSNHDTKAMYGGSVPRFAAGTTQIPPSVRNLLTALGLWIPQTPSGGTFGPRTKDDAYGGWQDFQRKGEQALQGAADTAGSAFEDAAKKTGKAFQDVLGGVPGLFGTSQVTADQMRLAEAGIPQNFADDWRRQLNDEVLNGVEWGDNVDIKDAARRAGIDPNLPNDIILELVNQAWSNGSFFANPANLDLVNMEAVQADMLQKQKEMQGKQNLMGLFGITDENLQAQIESLGTDIASMFGGAAESDAVKGAGVAVFGAVMGGFGDSNTAVSGVAGMATAIQTATGTPENQQLLYDGGMAAYGSWLNGWKAAAAEAPITPPGGGTTPPAGTPPTGPVVTPPQKAVGVGYWYGGWMTVHANETIYAPRGTAVRTARESAGDGGQTVINNYVTVNRAIDEEAFLSRMARRLQRGH